MSNPSKPPPPPRRPSTTRRSTSTRRTPPSLSELDVTESQTTEPNFTRFSPSGLLSSLRGTTPQDESRPRSRPTKPQNPGQPSRASRGSRRREEETSSSSSDASASGSDDDEEDSRGLGNLIRSLHDSNETHSLRERRRKRANPDESDSVRSRRSGSGSSRGSKRDLSRSGSRLGRARSAGSGRSGSGPGGEREGSGGSAGAGGGLPTVEERSASLNSTTRPPPPAPSHSFTQKTIRPTPQQFHQSSFQRWWAPDATAYPPFTTTSHPLPGQTPAISPSRPPQAPPPPSPLTRSASTETSPNPASSSNPPLIVSRPSSSSTLDPRHLHDAHHQNLNEPFIPLVPHHAKSVPKKIGGRISNYLSALDPGGRASMANDEHAGTAPLQTIAALIATTGNLSGVVSPTCATIAPVWSYEDRGDVSGGSGGRRLSRYTRQEAVEDPEMKQEVDRREKEDRKHDRRVQRRRRVRSEREEAARSTPQSSESEPDHSEADETHVNYNERSQEDEHLDVIAEEGTNELLRTEGAAVQAFPGEYAEGERHNSIPSPKGSTTATLQESPEEIEEDEEGFPFEEDGGTEVDVEHEGEKRRRNKSGGYAGWVGSKRGERVQREIYIKSNRGTQTQIRDFIVRLANAHMVFGSPTHRLESQLESTARVLELDAHFFYLPSHLILCFNNPRKQTSETAFLRAVGSLDSAKLARVHAVNRDVLHDVISASEGSRLLKEITMAPSLHNLSTRIAIIGMCSFFAAPVAFDGSFIDMFASLILGSLMGLCQLTLAATNPLFLNCFEIAMAILVSFIAKGLSATGYFCYQATASAGIVMILPGFIILNGALELASRSVVAGSIRTVYGCVLSLFLGVGVSIGSEIFVAMYPAAKGDVSTVSLTGTFNSSDPSIANPISNGTFTFIDSTASTVTGTVTCMRGEGLPWYMSSISAWYLFIIVPGFAFALAMWTKEVVRSKQFCASMVIATCAYVVLYFAKQAVPDQAEVSTAIAAFTIGILGTLWSRLARGTAFTTQSTAVLLLVPNGLAAAGGLAMSESEGSGSFEMGTQIALRQVSVAIGATMGLFAASLVTYSFSRRKRSAYFSY